MTTRRRRRDIECDRNSNAGDTMNERADKLTRKGMEAFLPGKAGKGK